MERLTIDELIAHCDRQLAKMPSGNIFYQEHESVRACLQMLRHYVGVGTVEEFRALKEAEQKRREGCEYCIGYEPLLNESGYSCGERDGGKAMINIEGYKTFHGNLIVKPVNGNEPFTMTGDWLYKPEYDCWYGCGESFPADICEAVEVDRVAELEELAIQQGVELNRRAELFYGLESRHKEAMELLEAAVAQLYGSCQCCGSDGIRKDDEPVMCEYDCEHLNHSFMIGWNQKPESNQHCKGEWRWQHADRYKALKTQENGGATPHDDPIEAGTTETDTVQDIEPIE